MYCGNGEADSCCCCHWWILCSSMVNDERVCVAHTHRQKDTADICWSITQHTHKTIYTYSDRVSRERWFVRNKKEADLLWKLVSYRIQCKTIPISFIFGETKRKGCRKTELDIKSIGSTKGFSLFWVISTRLKHFKSFSITPTHFNTFPLISNHFSVHFKSFHVISIVQSHFCQTSND